MPGCATDRRREAGDALPAWHHRQPGAPAPRGAASGVAPAGRGRPAAALELEPILLLLVACAFAAGFLDAVVGGGGLIQIPALFTALPQASPATLFGTNKVASIAGTASASLQYMRRIRLDLPMLVPAFACTLVGAWCGARVVAWLPKDAVRPAVLVALVVVAIVTLRRRDFGRTHAPRGSVARRRALGMGGGAVLGFYDGIFGPGTGMFFIFWFVRTMGFDFLAASAHAKLLNFASNLAALAFFVPAGHVLWVAALGMALANATGSLAGSRLALRGGAGFVRGVFVAMLVVLIGKFAWDTVAALARG